MAEGSAVPSSNSIKASAKSERARKATDSDPSRSVRARSRARGTPRIGTSLGRARKTSKSGSSSQASSGERALEHVVEGHLVLALEAQPAGRARVVDQREGRGPPRALLGELDEARHALRQDDLTSTLARARACWTRLSSVSSASKAASAGETTPASGARTTLSFGASFGVDCSPGRGASAESRSAGITAMMSIGKVYALEGNPFRPQGTPARRERARSSRSPCRERTCGAGMAGGFPALGRGSRARHSRSFSGVLAAPCGRSARPDRALCRCAESPGLRGEWTRET